MLNADAVVMGNMSHVRLLSAATTSPPIHHPPSTCPAWPGRDAAPPTRPPLHSCRPLPSPSHPLAATTRVPLCSHGPVGVPSAAHPRPAGPGHRGAAVLCVPGRGPGRRRHLRGGRDGHGAPAAAAGPHRVSHHSASHSRYQSSVSHASALRRLGGRVCGGAGGSVFRRGGGGRGGRVREAGAGGQWRCT